MSDDPPMSIGPGAVVDDFEIMEVIGRGAFSHVHTAKHIPTGNFCAAKIIELAAMKPEEFSGMIREVSVFMQVDHPNICNLYRTSVSGETLIFFMEFAPGGTLLDYVNGRGHLSEIEAKRFTIQAFAGLRHLHLYHYLAHRDLKLENLLLDSRGQVRVTDFGLAGTYCNYQMRTFVGTAGYQPPEIIAGNDYTDKCDVWSLGVCIYAMVTGKLPFTVQAHDCRRLCEEAKKFKCPSGCSPQLADLLGKMFAVSPAERPALMQLQGHPWLQGLQQIGANVAPEPIRFYSVTKASGIQKFKRRSVKADPKILAQCEGVDQQQLTEELKAGVTSAATTQYFFRMRPMPKKPEPKPPAPAQKVDVPNARKNEPEKGATSVARKSDPPPEGPKPPLGAPVRRGAGPAATGGGGKSTFVTPLQGRDARITKPNGGSACRLSMPVVVRPNITKGGRSVSFKGPSRR